jgi:hypothetical protein
VATSATATTTVVLWVERIESLPICSGLAVQKPADLPRTVQASVGRAD